MSWPSLGMLKLGTTFPDAGVGGSPTAGRGTAAAAPPRLSGTWSSLARPGADLGRTDSPPCSRGQRRWRVYAPEPDADGSRGVMSWRKPSGVEPVTTTSPVMSSTATVLGWRTVAYVVRDLTALPLSFGPTS